MKTDANTEAEFLARLRDSGISIDREGRFWHEGQTVQHEGLRQALFRWLDRLPATAEQGARYILRLDARRFAYIDVEDTPLVATSLRWQRETEGDKMTAWVGLGDGSEERLDTASLTIDDEGVLRCWVRGGQLEARLATSAAATLAEQITVRDQRPCLNTPAGPMPIPPRAPDAR